MKPGYLLLPAILVVLFILSCSKNGSNGKPVFSLESIERNPIGPNDSMIAHFKFSNTGGKVANGVFVSIRNRITQTPINPSDSSGSDTLYNPIPDIEGAAKGEFRYSLPANGYLNQSASLASFGINDTIIMQFFVLSSAGVSSDTISAPKFVVLTK